MKIKSFSFILFLSVVFSNMAFAQFDVIGGNGEPFQLSISRFKSNTAYVYLYAEDGVTKIRAAYCTLFSNRKTGQESGHLEESASCGELDPQTKLTTGNYVGISINTDISDGMESGYVMFGNDRYDFNGVPTPLWR